MTLRKLAEISRKCEIPMMKSKEIMAKTKRLLLKWYIGKFPILRREEPIPQTLRSTTPSTGTEKGKVNQKGGNKTKLDRNQPKPTYKIT